MQQSNMHHLIVHAKSTRSEKWLFHATWLINNIGCRRQTPQCPTTYGRSIDLPYSVPKPKQNLPERNLYAARNTGALMCKPRRQNHIAQYRKGRLTQSTNLFALRAALVDLVLLLVTTPWPASDELCVVAYLDVLSGAATAVASDTAS